MKNHPTIAKVLSLSLCLAAFSAGVLAQDKAAQIEALVGSFEARERFSGVGLVARDGNVLFGKACVRNVALSRVEPTWQQLPGDSYQG